MIGIVDGYLNFNTKINLAGFSAGIKSINNGIDKLKSAVGSLLATMGLALGTKELIENAAEVNAEMSQLEQTFGSLEETAVSAMRRVADESGILESRLYSVGTRIYAFAKTSGMDSVQALSMMEDALQIAADSAAYYDRSLEETAETLQSFLKGNYANDAALGLSATEATRNAKAMELYGKSFQNLTEAQKQLALLDMVRDANRLSGAMGQAARESEGWENVIGNLKEAWRQLMAVVGQPALHIAIDVVKNLTNALAALTEQAKVASATLNRVFGWEKSGSDAVTASIAQSIDEQEGLTEAVEETAKAQEMMLAGFDKITKLGDNSTNNSTASDEIAVTPTVNTSSIAAAAEEAADDAERVFDKLLEALEPFKLAWEADGEALVASAQRTVDNIKALFGSIGDSLYEVWTSGTGEQIVSLILRTFTDLSDTAGNLTGRFTVAWETDDTGTGIIQNAADHLMILLRTVEECAKATSEWAAELDFSPLLKSFSGLQSSLTPLLDDLGKAVSWVWENVFLPLGKWVIEEALPASLDVLSGALGILDEAIKALKPYGQWLWDEFIQPLAEWTGEIIVTGLEGLAAVLHDIGDWIGAHPDAAVAIGGITTAFLGLYATLSGGLAAAAAAKLGTFLTTLGALNVTIGVIVAGIVSWGYVITELHDNWDDIMMAIEESGGVFGFLSGWLEDCRADIEEFFDMGKFGQIWCDIWEAVGGYVHDKLQFISGLLRTAKEKFVEFLDGIRKKYTEIKDNLVRTFEDIRNSYTKIKETIRASIEKIPGYVGDKLKSAYESTVKPFEKIGEWAFDRVEDIKKPFRSIAEWFRDTFSEAWQNVLDVFSRGGSVFEGIESGIASVFKNTVNSLIDGINYALIYPFWNIKEALRVLREWEFAGITPFYWMPDIDIPQIPRLAQGTVVPANYGEFLAVLGDNKRETEVVSPVSKIEEAVGNVLSRMNFGGDLNLTIELEGKPIYKDIIRLNNQSIRMTGKNPLNPAPKGVTT